MNSFWQQLKNPFFILAPMFDVTDAAFRQMVLKFGQMNQPQGHLARPDVFFTEFVSVDGLVHPASQEKLIRHYLQFEDNERPIVMQVFGNNPDHFYKTAQLAARLKFDGLDINMGCPDKKVMKNGMGAALCLDPQRAQEVILAAQEGAGGLPVSVKTRLGYDKDISDKWLPHLLETKPAAVTLHARTAKQMSRVPADWEAIGRLAKMAQGTGTLVVGNGDVKSLQDARERVKRSGADGVMIGRGIFENLWVFNKNVNPTEVSPQQRVALAVEHARLFEHYFAGIKNFHMMYKHFTNYVSGFSGAKEMRQKLMSTKTAKEVAKIDEEVLERTL